MTAFNVAVWQGSMYEQFELVPAAIDAAMLLALSLLAVRTPRTWLLLVAALQLLAVFGHVGKLLNPAISPLVYALTTGSSSYFQLIALAIGLVSDGRIRRRQSAHRA